MLECERHMREKRQIIFPLLPQKDSIEKKIIMKGVPSTFSPNKSLKELIKEGWKKATDTMLQKEWSFYDGPLLRFEDIKKVDNELHILVSPSITYKDVVGIRAHPEKSYKQLTQKERPNSLSTINIIVTSDNIIFMGLRESGDWDESFELSGGFMRVEENNPYESTLNRLNDDFNIKEDEIDNHTLLSISHLPSILETMFIYKIKLGISSRDLIKKGSRYNDVAHVPNSVNGYEEFKKTLPDNIPIHAPSEAVLDFYFSNIKPYNR